MVFFLLQGNAVSANSLDEHAKSLERIYECINQENPAVTILTGDFNARSPLFWENDTENRGGRVFNNVLISNNLEELINEPTHIRDDDSQSCIDLICTDQPYVFIEVGVLPLPRSSFKTSYYSWNFKFS